MTKLRDINSQDRGGGLGALVEKYLPLIRLPDNLGPYMDWVWIGAAVLVLLTIGLFSVEDVEPGQVAVKVNNFTGSETPVTRPGWTTRIPFVHSVYKLDARPQTFKMKGTSPKGALQVPELSVRASDGANFHFTDTTIIFQLDPGKVVVAMRHTGQKDGFLEWMKPFARSILRDEFGRESTIDVSNPTTYGAAAARAKKRLNDLLAPHGIIITQLVTPRPRFNQAYEQAIEERNSLNNKLEVIKSELERAATSRARQLAEVDQKQNNALQNARAQLEAALAGAVAKQAQMRADVDTLRIRKLAEGQAALSASQSKAKQLQGELEARYKAMQAKIAAFRTQSVERVMERLGKKLRGVTISIQPWSRDATPSVVEYRQQGK